MTRFAKIRLSVPDLNRTYVSGTLSYSKASVYSQNLAMLRTIMAINGKNIEKWGNVFEIDREIVTGFIAAESGGRNLSPNEYGATGQMQMTAGALAEAIPKWTAYQKQPMPSEAVNYMNSVAPFLMKLKRDQGMTPTQKKIVVDLLKNEAGFNIMAGCLYLRWLLTKFDAQLNKSMVAYNAGPYLSVIAGKVPVTTESLVSNKKVPLESRKYLLKLLGVNGFLDIIFQKKLF